jgi:hypothetical protein
MFTADCGHPKPPADGYILPYTNTVEGARVIFACQSDTQVLNSSWYEVEYYYSTMCRSNGKWEPYDPIEFCHSKYFLLV